MSQAQLDGPRLPCVLCLRAGVFGSGGGWHRLTHLSVDGWQMCVDVGIADAVVAVRTAGIVTTNSCEAWQWWPNPTGRPNYHRIDVLGVQDAERAADLLRLTSFLIEATAWGHVSLFWLPDGALRTTPRRRGE